MFLLPYYPPQSEPEFDGEAFYEAVENTLRQCYHEEKNIRSFDWLINDMGENGMPCHEVAADIYNHIVDEHTCPDCGCDNRIGCHQVLRSDCWNEPSYYCDGERRQFPK